MSRDLGSRTEIEQTLDTGLDNVFSEEPAETAARNAQDAAPTTYTEWGGGASSDEDYNLEAFVAAEAESHQRHVHQQQQEREIQRRAQVGEGGLAGLGEGLAQPAGRERQPHHQQQAELAHADRHVRRL